MNFEFLLKPEFWRWYLGIAEILFGVAFLVWAPIYGNPIANYFKRELKDPAIGERFGAVLARRKSLEDLSPTPWRVVGAIALVLGIAALLGILQPIVSFAALSLCAGVVLAAIFSSLRNRGERRAALLTPRTSTTQIPLWVYTLTSFMVLAPLSNVSNAELRFSSIIVSLVGVVLIITAFIMSNGMAALLTGDDTAVEVAVDDRLRRMRIGTCLNLATGSAFMFMAMTMAMRLIHKPLPVFAFMLSSFASLALWFWYMRKWQIPVKLIAAELDGR